MEINISEIQIIPVKPRNGLLAFVSFVINKALYVGDVAIYSRLDGKGYRLSYPIKVLSNGAKINCFHPINREIATSSEEQVIKVFLELTRKVQRENREASNE